MNRDQIVAEAEKCHAIYLKERNSCWFFAALGWLSMLAIILVVLSDRPFWLFFLFLVYHVVVFVKSSAHYEKMREARVRFSVLMEMLR